MADILAGLSGVLQGAVAWQFYDAQLAVDGTVKTVAANGAVTAAPAILPCKARVNFKTTVTPDGGTVTITRVLILAQGLTQEPKAGNVVTIQGKAYKLGPVRRDGIASHFMCEVVDG